ncbi:hypothetical protein BJ170DRAFT_589841 [Xylariales sp. AK1849]|nr:hypothetical protein BJ170DRAFT_589841 [Xylariales sp. AK1849]
MPCSRAQSHESLLNTKPRLIFPVKHLPTLLPSCVQTCLYCKFVKGCDLYSRGVSAEFFWKNHQDHTPGRTRDNPYASLPRSKRRPSWPEANECYKALKQMDFNFGLTSDILDTETMAKQLLQPRNCPLGGLLRCLNIGAAILLSAGIDENLAPKASLLMALEKCHNQTRHEDRLAILGKIACQSNRFLPAIEKDKRQRIELNKERKAMEDYERQGENGRANSQDCVVYKRRRRSIQSLHT